MSSEVRIPIELIDAFGAGVYLLFGIVHLDLWMHRRERKSHLWLAVASAGALLVDLSGMTLRPLGATMPPWWLASLNLGGVAVTTAAIVELVAAIGSRPTGRLVRVVQWTAIAVATIAILPPGAALTLVLCFVLLIVAMARAVDAGRHGDRESRMIASGLIVLIVCLLFDVLMELGVIPTLSGLPVVGFTFLFANAARALNLRYEREHRELAALRNELESRVLDRTVELEAANRRLEEMARTDTLTGLLNRRGFLEACAHELTRATRSGKPWSIVMGDLDHFKEINDRHGHATGDAVLRDAAAVLRRAVRSGDLAARWGGEEFIFFLPETDAEGALVAAEAVRRAVEAHAFTYEGKSFALTISLGIAEERPPTLEATIDAADRALYTAKQSGRNRVERTF